MQFLIIIIVIVSIVSRISRSAKEEAARKARAAAAQTRNAADQTRSTAASRAPVPTTTRPPADGPFNPWFTDSAEGRPTPPQHPRPANGQSNAEALKRKREEVMARMRRAASEQRKPGEQTGSLPPSREGYGGSSEGRASSEGSRLKHTLSENTKGRNATLQEGEGFEQSFSGSLDGTGASRPPSLHTRMAPVQAAPASALPQNAHQTAMDVVYGLREPQNRHKKLVEAVILREILDPPLALRRRA